jgi:hypothetical protein
MEDPVQNPDAEITIADPEICVVIFTLLQVL